MNLVLGVSGSVAAYRAADLARELMRQGFTVRVCLTDAGQKFVTPALFEALTGQPCLIDTFEEPERGRMAHIDWARQAEVIVVAPATANTIARIAHGIGDDMLTTICLATTAPLIIAPAMNPQMYASDAHREALDKLRAWAAVVVEPAEGDVACGEHGQGKLASIAHIVEAVMHVHKRSQVLAGKTVLITSGPTQEALDDVRYLSNRSSGKMGSALARAALLMGAARVVVVSGPTSTPYPLRAEVIQVTTAEEMLAAGLKVAPDADLIIGAAAVADFRPASPQTGKIRRNGEPLSIELVPNPDVIAELAKVTKGKVIGFAAEPSSDLAAAREKITRKGLAAIAVNDVSQAGIGFDSENNEITLITAGGTSMESGKRSKLGCAIWLISEVLDHSS
ncbi:MAG: bifunctional phosphopantothenoylcysteine decarboxylase/phosphopantothenate--cysteine ligase CoaBC [Fimbriimonadales bacterium]